jgi:hypothetical protein
MQCPLNLKMLPLVYKTLPKTSLPLRGQYLHLLWDARLNLTCLADWWFHLIWLKISLLTRHFAKSIVYKTRFCHLANTTPSGLWLDDKTPLFLTLH